MVDEKRKIEALTELVGEDLTRQILSDAVSSEKSALDQQIEFKQTDEAEEEETNPVIPKTNADTEDEDEDEDEDEEEVSPPPGLTAEEEKCWWLNNGKKKKKPKKKQKETVILKRPKKAVPAGEEERQPPQQPVQAPPKPADYQKAESEPIAQRPAKAAVQVEDKAPDQPAPKPDQPAPQQVEKPAPKPQAPVQAPAQPEQSDAGEYEEVEMEEVPLPEVIGNMTIEEFGELLASALSEALMPYLQTVKDAKSSLEKARLEFEVSAKEKDDSKAEVTALKETVATLSGALERAAEKIAGLEGEVPAIASPYVASASADTILEGEEDAKLKESYPKESNNFIDWVQKPIQTQ